MLCGLQPRHLGRDKYPNDGVKDKRPGLFVPAPPGLHLPAPPAPTFTASFSILMNFGFNGKTHILFSGMSENPSASTVALCGADEIYDPFAEQCRKVHCEEGYEPVNGDCTLLSEIGKLNKNITRERVYVVLDVDVPKADLDFYASEEFQQVHLRKSVSSYLNVSIDRLTKVHVYVPDSSDGVKFMGEFNHVDGTMHVVVKIAMELEASTEEAVVFEEKLESMSALTLFNTVVFKVNVTRLSDADEGEWCTNGHKFLFLDKDFTILPMYLYNESITAIYVNKTNKVYTEGNFDLTIVVQGDMWGKDIAGFVFVCEVGILDLSCPRVKLSPSEYEILPNKSMIYHGEIFFPGAYSDFEDGVEICITDDDTARRVNMTELEFAKTCNFGHQWIFDAIQNYSTIIIGILSIVTTAMTLLVYAILNQLRNLPGYCTINLGLALLLAQTLFLFGSNKDNIPVLCIVVAMTLHYLFLASFFWMNVMAYDVFRTFTQTGVENRCQKIGRYLWKYMLYAWGFPAAIVGICATIDFIHISDGHEASIGYGWTKSVNKYHEIMANNSKLENNATRKYFDGDLYEFASGFGNAKGCWIRQPTAASVAFGGPIIVMLLANAVFFAKTILAIKAAKRSSARQGVRRVSILDQVVVTQKLVENDFKIYVRISTLMGFTWIFGLTSSFISAVAGNEATYGICYTLHMLNLLFTLANCSQGIFIFVAFICNRKTWKLFRGTVTRFITTKQRSSRVGRLSACSTHPFENSERDKERAGADNPGFVGE
jgi:hypothetical protein